MASTPAYLTDPGFSLTSLLVNVPYLLRFTDGPTPVILMDTYDYDRLRGRVLTEENNEKIQSLGLAYEELRRRGILRFIDYAELYPPAVQQRMLRRNQAVIEETPSWIHQRAAVQGADGLVAYGWGEYQRSFRSRLGEELSKFDSQRAAVAQQRDDMERGRSDPAEWNQNVLNEYVTALEIRQRANQVLNLDVRGVVGQGDSELLAQLLTAESSNTTDLSHIERLDPIQNMISFNHTAAVQTRDILNLVGEIAADVAGVQHEDWSFLGSTLALPNYHDLFAIGRLRRDLRQMNVEQLAEEAARGIDILQARTDASGTHTKLQYEAGWLEEQAPPLTAGRAHREELMALTEYAVQQSRYSRELRVLAEQGDLSQAAAFIAASAMSDPTQRYETDDLSPHARDLLGQLGPSSVTDAQLETYRQRGDYLTGDTADTAPDWFETADRQR